MNVPMQTGGARVDALAEWNAMLRRVRERVPFYRERLPDRELASLEEVATLPFTVKDDFRSTYPLGLLAVPREDVVRLHMSSGTTGKPVVTAYTREDLELWATCMERVLRMAGVGPHDTVQNTYGYGLFTGGLGFHIGAERLGCTVIPASAGVTQRQVMLLRDLGTTVLTCTPSYALVLAEAVAASGGVDGLQLRAGIFGAEPWTAGMRREIEVGLGLEAFDIYGLTELGGPGIGVDCPLHHGLHVFEDHFYVEVVDPATGRVLPPGDEGELVLTSFHRQASPVIRYRTRDRTVLLDDPCPCGSPFRRVQRLLGRTDDMLVVRGENVFPSQVEEVLLRVAGLTANYQLVVDRQAHRLDTLEVRVEAAPDAAREGLADRLRERVRETIGLGVDVSILEPGTMARSEGKARRVVDRREL
ncbi:MAG: phenylacetate--CoA ligase [Candidatus Dormibacteraeota bacterium]|nr:phenylacetate--CoA ligase [Candidatus Dormibacteraeota bacterium]MBO0705392.1 phenylacetate--CoA ligase [Candidatus Dormibacteraeota bacterium]MBO0762400.1 phenylacetate--CoA ligase [Candidatus Dormibacteraeota bacterium]